MAALFVLVIILLMVSGYVYAVIAKEYGHTMVPMYLYVIMAVLAVAFVGCGWAWVFL
jgi:hypothetical protein